MKLRKTRGFLEVADEGEFGRFAVCVETLIEAIGCSVVAGGHDGDLVKGLCARGKGRARCGLGPAKGVGVSVEGSQSGKSGDLSSIAFAEFGPPSHQDQRSADTYSADQAQILDLCFQRLGLW